jgi:hypothetical protein
VDLKSCLNLGFGLARTQTLIFLISWYHHYNLLHRMICRKFFKKKSWKHAYNFYLLSLDM